MDCFLLAAWDKQPLWVLLEGFSEGLGLFCWTLQGFLTSLEDFGWEKGLECQCLWLFLAFLSLAGWGWGPAREDPSYGTTPGGTAQSNGLSVTLAWWPFCCRNTCSV